MRFFAQPTVSYAVLIAIFRDFFCANGLLVLATTALFQIASTVFANLRCQSQSSHACLTGYNVKQDQISRHRSNAGSGVLAGVCPYQWGSRKESM